MKKKKEYFCPTCKKFVTEIKSEFGARVTPSFLYAGGELPTFVCRDCSSPVMEMEKIEKE